MCHLLNNHKTESAKLADRFKDVIRVNDLKKAFPLSKTQFSFISIKERKAFEKNHCIIESGKTSKFREMGKT